MVRQAACPSTGNGKELQTAPLGLDAAKQYNAKDNAMGRQIMRLAGALALAAAPFSCQAVAQTAATSGATVPFVTQQLSNEWLAGVFIGQAVRNAAGETVGDINDLVFDRQGRINTVVIGVGGFLGMGEKSVGVPFNALVFNIGGSGERLIVIAAGKEALINAPAFRATEKTTFDKLKDKAADLSHKAADKAVELKDQAARKIEDMKKSEPAKQ